MKHQTAPLLSIGMIFKDDIRCIERCLKALQPLRDAVPCELIMADTGSTDGSREVAGRYADVLFDFPWVNDFSAARNAVMDRASGAWYLTVDTDEYLRPDVSQLVLFLASGEAAGFQAGTVIIRNHSSYEMDETWDDFMALRLVRMSSGIRYEGEIHEHWDFGGRVKVFALSEIVFDHDGYVEMHKSGSEAGKAKLERNLKLIRKALERKPEDLMLHMQLLESGSGEPDYLDQVLESLELVRAKKNGWEKAGPPLLRYAIFYASSKKLPELEEWMQLMEDWFPDSMYNRLDVNYIRISQSWEEKNYSECIRQCERYLQGMEDYRKGADADARMFSTMRSANPGVEQDMKIILAGACHYQGQTERAVSLLEGIDFAQLNQKYTADLLKVAHEIQLKSFVDTSSLICAVWDGISKPEPSQKRANERKKIFIRVAGLALEPKARKKESEQENFCRHSYTLYLPLRGRCEQGTAAAILNMWDRKEMETSLSEVENWNWFSIHALAHALAHGVQFPLPGRLLNVEEMDSLANRLAQNKGVILALALQEGQAADASDWQKLFWAKSLVLSAMRAFSWNEKDADTNQGISLARAFTGVERVFLPLYYAPDVLCAEKLFALPPLHRFGWYCVQAFEALDAGDTAGYVRLLREGLNICEDVKDVVEFMVEHTPEVQMPAPSAELLALAEQIRTVLAGFAPDNPAVAVLKQSEAYQKVAYLIEGIEPPIVGGQMQ